MAKLCFTGSIELTAIPKEVIKVVTTKDGKRKMFLNFAVLEMDKPSDYGDTHCITCAPKKEERREDVNYLCGHLKPWVEKEKVSPEQIAAAPTMGQEERFPWDEEPDTF